MLFVLLPSYEAEEVAPFGNVIFTALLSASNSVRAANPYGLVVLYFLPRASYSTVAETFSLSKPLGFVESVLTVLPSPSKYVVASIFSLPEEEKNCSVSFLPASS